MPNLAYHAERFDASPPRHNLFGTSTRWMPQAVVNPSTPNANCASQSSGRCTLVLTSAGWNDSDGRFAVATWLDVVHRSFSKMLKLNLARCLYGFLSVCALGVLGRFLLPGRGWPIWLSKMGRPVTPAPQPSFRAASSRGSNAR